MRADPRAEVCTHRASRCLEFVVEPASLTAAIAKFLQVFAEVNRVSSVAEMPLVERA